MIPDEAVEAAARGLAVQKWPTAIGVWDSFGQGMKNDFRDQARAALEAAAPHLMAAILALHSKSIGSYTDADGCKWTGDYCQHCRREWPCETAELVESANG